MEEKEGWMNGVARQIDALVLTTDCSICLCFVLKRNDVFKYRIHGSGSKAKIIEGNIIASNGVIHITNSLLTHEPNAVGDITVILICRSYSRPRKLDVPTAQDNLFFSSGKRNVSKGLSTGPP